MLQYLPNALTLLRILIALVFPFTAPAWHLALIAVGLLTEFLDGLLARWLKSTSYLGQVLDPVADKLLVLSVSLTWVWLDRLSILQWLLLATRDFGVLLIFLVLVATGRIRSVRSVEARLPSKITTAMQYAVFLLVALEYLEYLAPLIAATALVGAAAALHYAYLLRQELFNRSE